MGEFDRQRAPQALLPGAEPPRPGSEAQPLHSKDVLVGPQAERSPVQEAVSTALRFDRNRPAPERLHADPALAALAPIISEIDAHQTRFPELKLSSINARREAALWIARNLHGRGLSPTAENITAALHEAVHDRRELYKIPLFRGRNTVVLAHAETWPQLKGEAARTPVDARKITSIIAATGDLHRFGSQALIFGLKEAVGEERTVTLLRPELSVEQRMFELLQMHHETLSRWPGRPAARESVSKAEIKRDIRSILSLPADQPIDLQFTTAGNAPHIVGTFIVKANERLIFDCTMKLDNLRPTELISNHPSPPYEHSPEVVKRDAITQIAACPPGPKGFLFMFEGHGDPAGLYLVDGQAAGGASVLHGEKAVVITATEFAGALIARARNFSDTDRDIYVFNQCFPKDFVDQVRPLIEGKIVPPIFICQNEYGQFGYSDYSKYDNRLNRELLEYDQSLRGAHGRSASVGDAADLFLEQPYRFRSNPVIMAPAHDPSNPLRSLKLLNQSAGIALPGMRNLS